MDRSTILRYRGYVKTPSLFRTNGLPEINQIELSSEFEAIREDVKFKNQRLGKLVEEFVFYQLKQQPNVKWIVENLQIQKERKTIGELDALYFLNDKPIHLEVVYKFYLYDTLKSYEEPLSYWIGPNRKDSLCYKLDKLKNKQYPLLFQNETSKELNKYNIDTADVLQKLCFKAQLFLPYNDSKINFEILNENCVSGIYISFHTMSIFKTLKFYMPQKLDWLVLPHNNVLWQDYETTKIKILDNIEERRSPLVWLKYSETKFVKCFITFW
ncbi:DUF1853 family protein [Winogradskyella thalassocola]|uniref:DUF1853 domain-containing protein n=1 Tax=Winogradskyella thalassocola TaxID=262004 RepID=A0A1G8E667_9FLAO|nr:DUF1853 family protein [Winogradskyella thalassocola]SDH65139.1 hypothetical protein SAMN04489796_103392 [Winogradskyella thalassocola]